MGPALVETTVLGLVYGVTDVLPLSSDAHVALARLLLGLRLAPYDAWMVRVGTWLGVALFFGGEAVGALREVVRGVSRPALLAETRRGRDAIVITVATAATVVVATGLRAQVDAWDGDPTLVGGCLFVSALALGSTFWTPQGEHDAPTPWGALMVGAAQGAALLPGLSRSSMTLTSLLWLGVRAPRAVELCFLIWLPAGLASLLINRAGGPCPDKQMAALAMSTAMGAALAALYVLRAAATRRLLPAFSLYLVPLAFATMAWGYARP